MEALVKRGVRSGLCAADAPNLTELIEYSDDALSNRVLCNQDHILFPLLPGERDFTYNIRKRNHNRLLTIKQGRLCSCNFITKMFFKAYKWLCSISFYSRYFSLICMYYCVIVAFCQHVLNEHAMLWYSGCGLHFGPPWMHTRDNVHRTLQKTNTQLYSCDNLSVLSSVLCPSMTGNARSFWDNLTGRFADFAASRLAVCEFLKIVSREIIWSQFSATFRVNLHESFREITAWLRFAVRERPTNNYKVY